MQLEKSSLTIDKGINTGHNSTFAIGGVSCSADSFVVNQTLVLRMDICGVNTAHRKSAKRQAVK